MDNRGRTESLTKLAKYGVAAERLDAAIALGQRWCSGCKTFADKNQFSSDKVLRCRACQREYSKKYNLEHGDSKRARANEHYAENRERLSGSKRKWWASLSREQRSEIGIKNRLRSYGLTLEDYNRILESQGGHCALCPRTPGKRMLPVDHDHETGIVRGILCIECNVVIGHFEKHRDRIPAFEEYLKKFHVRHSEVT